MKTKQNKEAEKIVQMFFTQLDNIYKACESSAKAYDSKHIPLSILKIVINVTKEGMKEGMKEGI